jgi:hypothetical protein
MTRFEKFKKSFTSRDYAYMLWRDYSHIKCECCNYENTNKCLHEIEKVKDKFNPIEICISGIKSYLDSEDK